MIDKSKLEKFFKLLSEGNNIRNSCKLSNINEKSVNYYLKKYKITPINKFSNYKIKGNYFDIIDTEEKAYFLGLLLADGCIHISGSSNDLIKTGNSYRISISLQEKDGYLLDVLSKELGIEKPIKISNNQNGVNKRKPQRRFRFGSKYMAQSLMNKYNINPRKTLDTTFKFPMESIPSNLIRHFIRGYFDGDGSISFYKTKQSFYFNFSFVFTSKLFGDQIANIFIDKFNIIPVVYSYNGKTTDWYSLRFKYNQKRRGKIKEIYDWMYENSNVMMIRKKIKFEEYLNTVVSN